MNDARHQFIIDLVCKVKIYSIYRSFSTDLYADPRICTWTKCNSNFFVFPFHKFKCLIVVRMFKKSGTWEIFNSIFHLSFLLSLQENIDIIVNTATPWKFVILVPVEQVINWGPLHLTKCSIHSSPDDKTAISGQKCVRAFIPECVTVFKCFWAKEVVGWASSLSLWYAPLYSTDYNICAHNCKASWVGKRFRSKGSRMKGTSRWAMSLSSVM